MEQVFSPYKLDGILWAENRDFSKIFPTLVKGLSEAPMRQFVENLRYYVRE